MNDGPSCNSTNHRWGDIMNRVTSWGLIATGLLGVVIGVLDVFLELDTVLPVKEPLAILVVLVSILALALGVERRATIEELGEDIRQTHSYTIGMLNYLTREITNVEQALVSTLSVRALTDERMVYGEAIQLVNAAKDSDTIRATSLGAGTSLSKSPPFDEYLLAVARRVKTSKERGGALTYRVVMGYGPTNGEVPPLKRQQAIRQRRQLFGAAGVLDRLFIRSVDTSWSLDMLIVGDSMIVGFPTLSRETVVRLGLRISDKRFVGCVSQWFDDFLWDAASVETWTGEEGTQ